MIGGKKFRTLREAKEYQTKLQTERYDFTTKIYKLKGKVFKYFVGTHLEWINL